MIAELLNNKLSRNARMPKVSIGKGTFDCKKIFDKIPFLRRREAQIPGEICKKNEGQKTSTCSRQLGQGALGGRLGVFWWVGGIITS